MTDQSHIHSTGRGGAGNIGRDESEYEAASIVREEVPGQHAPTQYHTGRGGAGNFGSPKTQPQGDDGLSQDQIPESVLRKAPENYHVGRGGGGNVHKEHHEDAHKGAHEEHTKESIGDKVKHALHLDGKKSGNPTS